MKKATAANLALLLASFLGAILMSEMALRLLEEPEKRTVIKNTIREERFPYSFIPGSTFTETTPEFSMSVEINAVGLRDYEYGKNYFDDRFVILGTGDSFAWGVGVRMEEGYLAVAEKILNMESGKTRIIKAGMPGYNPLEELDFLKYHVQEKLNVTFNLITISFLPHDVDEMLSHDSMRYEPDVRVDLQSLSGVRRLVKGSRIYRHISKLGLFRVFKGKTTIYYGRMMNQEERRAILRMIQRAESFSTSTPILFVLIPQMDNVIYKAYPDMFKVVKEVSTATNISFIDTYDELAKYDPYSVFYKKDQHLTKLGQKVVGEILARTIIDMNILPN